MDEIAAFYASSVSLDKTPEGVSQGLMPLHDCVRVCVPKQKVNRSSLPAVMVFCKAIGRNSPLNAPTLTLSCCFLEQKW